MRMYDHRELIAVMTELWTLLDELAIIEPGALQLPPTDSGVHPASIFDADVALAAGYSPEAVAVMSALPYLHDSGQKAIEIEGSTFPLSFLHSDEYDFSYRREMFSDDNLMPPSAFRLTWQDVNGWEYIYDTEKRQYFLFPGACCSDTTDAVLTGLVYIWNNINDPEPTYFHLHPVPPREAFQLLIDKFRTLHRVGAQDCGFTDQDTGPEPWQFSTTKEYEARHKVWKAMCGVADLYLECGWDVHAVAQRRFRRGEFIDERTRYLAEILEPLKEAVYTAHETAQ